MLSWLNAARPYTLIAGFTPIVLSLSLASYENDIKNFSYFYLGLGIVICLQTAVNFFNDAIDYENGADLKREGPARMAASGLLTPEKLKKAGLCLTIIAFVLMIPYFSLHPLYFILAPTCLYFTYGYTGGPLPLAYNGLGEIFVFIYFGLIAFLGSYFALVQNLSLYAIAMALLCAFTSTLIIALNNLRDRRSDALVNKKTLAVLLGEKNFIRIIIIILIFVMALRLFFIIDLSFVPAYKLLASIIMAFPIYIIIRLRKTSDYAKIFGLTILNLSLDFLYFTGGLIGHLP